MIILKMSVADNVVKELKKEADKRKVSITKCAYDIIKERLNIESEVDT